MTSTLAVTRQAAERIELDRIAADSATSAAISPSNSKSTPRSDNIRTASRAVVVRSLLGCPNVE